MWGVGKLQSLLVPHAVNNHIFLQSERGGGPKNPKIAVALYVWPLQVFTTRDKHHFVVNNEHLQVTHDPLLRDLPFGQNARFMGMWGFRKKKSLSKIA